MLPVTVALMVTMSYRGCLLHFIENLCFIQLWYSLTHTETVWEVVKIDWLCVATVYEFVSGPKKEGNCTDCGFDTSLLFFCLNEGKLLFLCVCESLLTWLWTRYTVFVKIFILRTWPMYIKLYFPHKQLVSIFIMSFKMAWSSRSLKQSCFHLVFSGKLYKLHDDLGLPCVKVPGVVFYVSTQTNHCVCNGNSFIFDTSSFFLIQTVKAS